MHFPCLTLFVSNCDRRARTVLTGHAGALWSCPVFLTLDSQNMVLGFWCSDCFCLLCGIFIMVLSSPCSPLDPSRYSSRGAGGWSHHRSQPDQQCIQCCPGSDHRGADPQPGCWDWPPGPGLLPPAQHPSEEACHGRVSGPAAPHGAWGPVRAWRIRVVGCTYVLLQ